MVHARGCFSAVLITDVLLNGVRGEDMREEGTDFRFALLGVGIGLLLALCLLVVKLYMMGKCKCPCTEAHMHSGGYKMPSFTTPQSPTSPSLRGCITIPTAMQKQTYKYATSFSVNLAPQDYAHGYVYGQVHVRVSNGRRCEGSAEVLWGLCTQHSTIHI